MISKCSNCKKPNSNWHPTPDFKIPKRGKFIVIEGLDKSGKTTQCKILQERMAQNRHNAKLTQEPTNGPIGNLIQNMNLTDKNEISERVLAMLCAADRMDHVENPRYGGIYNTLNRDKIHVISERYFYTSFAYHLNDLPWETVVEINKPIMDYLIPDLTVFIDISPKESIKRMNTGMVNETEMGHIYAMYHRVIKNIGEGYVKWGPMIVVPGDVSVGEIHSYIWECVEKILEE